MYFRLKITYLIVLMANLEIPQSCRPISLTCHFLRQECVVRDITVWKQEDPILLGVEVLLFELQTMAAA